MVNIVTYSLATISGRTEVPVRIDRWWVLQYFLWTDYHIVLIPRGKNAVVSEASLWQELLLMQMAQTPHMLHLWGTDI